MRPSIWLPTARRSRSSTNTRNWNWPNPTKNEDSNMNIGFIGAGHIGGNLTRLAAKSASMARQGCGRCSIPAITRPMCSIRRLQCGDLLQALALRMKSARCVRSESARRHAGLGYPRLGSCAASRFTACFCSIVICSTLTCLVRNVMPGDFEKRLNRMVPTLWFATLPNAKEQSNA